jgi:hypothetical protein
LSFSFAGLDPPSCGATVDILEGQREKIKVVEGDSRFTVATVMNQREKDNR